MHPFGGSQICPRCSKAVYAAEQVMGPGRKLYHKPCLSCMICKKRLDSYTLLEHDSEPYCKSCYTKNFSTRDLRQANLPVREASASPTPTSPPRETNFNSSTPSLPPRVVSPVRQSNASPLSPPRLKPTHSLSIPTPPVSAPTSLDTVAELQPPHDGKETEPASEEEESRDTIDALSDSTSSPAMSRPVPPLPDRRSHQSTNSMGSVPIDNVPTDEHKRLSNPSFSTFGRGTNTTSAALSLLQQEGINPLVSTTTGTRYGAALGGKVAINMTGTSTGGSPRRWGAETPRCPKCSQRVYFAEQVKAVGQTWHKNCLRCRECNTLLDSNRLRDHDGVPFCVRCYSKLHGPQGSGYALLGKAGG